MPTWRLATAGMHGELVVEQMFRFKLTLTYHSPGRFFVAHELKMVVANLFLNYELRTLSERPKPQWIGVTVVPPVDAKIEIRRRKGTVKANER